MEWHRIGPSSIYLLVHDVDAYVKHFDPTMRARRKDEVHCLSIQNTRGASGGIGQEKVPLQKGTQYEFRIAVRISWQGVPEHRLHKLRRDKEVFPQNTQGVLEGMAEAGIHFQVSGDRPRCQTGIDLQRKTALEIGMVSLMPTDNFHGMRRDVVEHFKTIGATILRWPGGDFVGDYRWQDGLLDVVSVRRFNRRCTRRTFIVWGMTFTR